MLREQFPCSKLINDPNDLKMLQLALKLLKVFSITIKQFLSFLSSSFEILKHFNLFQESLTIRLQLHLSQVLNIYDMITTYYLTLSSFFLRFMRNSKKREHFLTCRATLEINNSRRGYWVSESSSYPENTRLIYR